MYTMQIRPTPEEKDWLMEAGPEKSDERRDLHTPRWELHDPTNHSSEAPTADK